MPHLVQPILRPSNDPIATKEVLRQIISAHHYLTELGANALKTNHEELSTDYWGTQLKRVKVRFEALRPELISDDHIEHSLIEVINQCATMERLIDALQWAVTYLPDYRLVRCHPTTSSKKDQQIPDNDIVLVDSNDQFAQFEVSDVSSNQDSNRKEQKDLESLGISRGSKMAEKQSQQNRKFMVVSKEFGERLSKSKLQLSGHFQYRQHTFDGMTRIFEVILI